MAGQADLSTCIQATCIQATCIQVTVFFSLGVWLGLKKYILGRCSVAFVAYRKKKYTTPVYISSRFNIYKMGTVISVTAKIRLWLGIWTLAHLFSTFL